MQCGVKQVCSKGWLHKGFLFVIKLVNLPLSLWNYAILCCQETSAILPIIEQKEILIVCIRSYSILELSRGKIFVTWVRIPNVFHNSNWLNSDS